LAVVLIVAGNFVRIVDLRVLSLASSSAVLLLALALVQKTENNMAVNAARETTLVKTVMVVPS
jgi:hypothetical protein